jgi:protein phosphatase
LALRGGGPDNVTVVVADVIDYDYGQTQPILAGAVSGDDDQVAPPDTAAGRASAFNPRRSEAKRVVPQPEEPQQKPRSRRRMFIAAVLLVLVVLAGLAIGREIVRSNYYVTEHDGTVSIMQGVQGSFLGLALQEPYLLGCLNARNELSLIRSGQSNDNLACRMLGVNDMRPSERAQVVAGLPSGTLDEAISQIEELARSSVLPTCAPRTPTPTTTTTSPSPTPHIPETPANPGIPEAGSETPAPETPTTVTAPAPAPPGPPPPGPPPPSPSPTPQPTVTALPPPPPEPGTNCREVS